MLRCAVQGPPSFTLQPGVGGVLWAVLVDGTKRMPKLDIYKSGQFSRDYRLPDSDVIVIGRTHLSDVVLPDEGRRVSRMHAALVRSSASQDRYFIRDLGSAHGTSVNGAITHQRMLNNGDTITISDYRLVFSTQTHAACRRSRIKIGRARGDALSAEGSTSILRFSSRDDHQQFTAGQRELLEQFGRKFQAGAMLSECASDFVAAVLRTIHADRGFIGFLSPVTSEVTGELGVTNLGEHDEIEISDASFAQHLLQGETVQDGNTLLIPFGRQTGAAGFICVNRRDQHKPLTARDGEFLSATSRLLPPCIEPDTAPITPSVAAAEPMEWPMEMVGKSKEWLQVIREVVNAARSRMNVLIFGESGSGKEVVARALHQRGALCSGPFLARNCSQTTETLAEAEIFGYAPKSGIAGADPKGAPGWFELANRGTLFLDEVHRLTPAMQDKFLRVLQDKQVWRIGARSPVQVEVNVVAATDEDLERALDDDRFRKPFFFRFGAKIRVPSLRQRPEDIPLLAYFFLDKYAKTLGSRARTISRRGLHLLWNHTWPGNVRQLEHVIQAAVARDHEVVFSWDLEDWLSCESTATAEKAAVPLSAFNVAPQGASARQKPKSMEEVEKEQIKEALEVTQGNATRAAEILGYKSRQTILNKMDRYGIPRNYADSKPN